MQIPGFYSQKIFEQKGKMGNFLACTGQESDRFHQPGNDRFWCCRLASKYRSQQTIQRTLDVIIIHALFTCPSMHKAGVARSISAARTNILSSVLGFGTFTQNRWYREPTYHYNTSFNYYRESASSHS